MKRIVVIIAVILSLQSCLTVGRIERNCDKFLKVCGTDRERVVEYRDTTLYVEKLIEVPVPFFKDSVRIRDSVRVVTVIDPVTKKEKHVAQMDTIYNEYGLIGMRVWVNNSKIGADAWLTDSTIWYNYQDWIRVHNGIKEVKEKVIVPVKFIPGFYKFTFWFFIAVMAVVVFWYIKNAPWR